MYKATRHDHRYFCHGQSKSTGTRPALLQNTDLSKPISIQLLSRLKLNITFCQNFNLMLTCKMEVNKQFFVDGCHWQCLFNHQQDYGLACWFSISFLRWSLFLFFSLFWKPQKRAFTRGPRPLLDCHRKQSKCILGECTIVNWMIDILEANLTLCTGRL